MSGFDLHVEYEERLARLEAENTRLREKLRAVSYYVDRAAELHQALREIADGEFDDLDPDDGLHLKSARAHARRALGDEA